MKGATPILSISTTMSQDEESRATSPERAGELCSNWWPVPSLANAKAIPGMPHPLCRMCANWMTDIEDMGPKKQVVVMIGRKNGMLLNHFCQQRAHLFRKRRLIQYYL